MEQSEGRARVIIEGMKPEIDSGRFPIRRVIGEKVVIEADIFADGHDSLTAVLLYRKEDDSKWTEIPMESLYNDRWRGFFIVREGGRALSVTCLSTWLMIVLRYG